ncbi:MAG: hypothetical protein PUC01_06510 [Spirochaetales bacterium]|nr:hypothetical protein [Spirochaetales bacterium]
MPYKMTLIAGRSEELRHSIFSKAIDSMQREDTIIISIGYWKRVDSLSYEDGIKRLIADFRYLDTPQRTLFVINDIVSLIDTPEGYLVPLLFELYKEKVVRFIIGTSRVSSEYITPHIRSLCSTIISAKLNSEMQSKILFGIKGAETLFNNEYLMKSNGTIIKGTLSECLKI